MLDWELLFRSIGGLMLAPMFVIAALFLVFSNDSGSKGHVGRSKHRFYAMIGILILAIVASLLPWLSLTVAARFDWSRQDVMELRLNVFDDPAESTTPRRSISITEVEATSRIFDAMSSMQPESLGRGHSVGRYFELRLRRRSDGGWSGYRLVIYPEWESGGLKQPVHSMRLNTDWAGLQLGDYQAPDLGRLLAELVERTGSD